MRILSWIVLGALGFGVMCWGYFGRYQADPRVGWAHGCIAIGPEREAPTALPGPAFTVGLRILPGNKRTEGILNGMESILPGKVAAMQVQLRPKLISLNFKDARIDETSLESGRLPAPGSDEAIAGPDSEQAGSLVVEKHSLAVVGRLKRDFGLFAGSYLVSASDEATSVLPRSDPLFQTATLVQLNAAQMMQGYALGQLGTAFPSPGYARAMSEEWLDRKSYFTFITGMAVLLLGGSGAFISLFRRLAERSAACAPAARQVQELPDGDLPVPKPEPGWLVAPLVEMHRRPVLVWGVHLAYFGLVFVGQVLIRSIPEVQTVLTSGVAEALAGHSHALGGIGAAYRSGSIWIAAGVTFGFNFFLGSLLYITLPSIVVPGSGSLLAALAP